jgi:hypothetical protein
LKYNPKISSWQNFLITHMEVLVDKH